MIIRTLASVICSAGLASQVSGTGFAQNNALMDISRSGWSFQLPAGGHGAAKKEGILGFSGSQCDGASQRSIDLVGFQEQWHR